MTLVCCQEAEPCQRPDGNADGAHLLLVIKLSDLRDLPQVHAVSHPCRDSGTGPTKRANACALLLGTTPSKLRQVHELREDDQDWSAEYRGEDHGEVEDKRWLAFDTSSTGRRCPIAASK
jgi:hypothetical protein